VFGDVENETKLFDTMKAEAESGQGLRTCILYPGPTAELMHDWIAEQEEKDRQFDVSTTTSGAAAPSPVINSKRKYRIIALDGTYGQAGKLMKHIENTLSGKLSVRAMSKLQGKDCEAEGAPDEVMNLNRFVHNKGVRKPNRVKPGSSEGDLYVPNYNITVPVVKLYLGSSGGCKSAIAGIMYQPRKDTLCTFQVGIELYHVWLCIVLCCCVLYPLVALGPWSYCINEIFCCNSCMFVGCAL